MFNNSLKKEAIRIHEQVSARYNTSYERLCKACERLYKSRTNAIETIKFVEKVVNSIANTPKEYSKRMGEINKELEEFRATEEYAQDAYAASVRAGVNIAGGAAAGFGMATMAPTALVSIATAFGKASTGTAISALSGAAAQKAAVAWIGRTFAGFAVEGAGMTAGNAFLALAGPVGWGITAASTGISLISFTKKNKEIADEVIEAAKEIAKRRESLDEASEKINAINKKTVMIDTDIKESKDRLFNLMHMEYYKLLDEDKRFLGSIVNNTLSLSQLLNESVG